MDHATVDYYNRNARACGAKYESADMSHLDHLLLRHLPEQGARVLELGCGSGREAAFLLQSGHDVRGIDASEGMIEEALRRHPELADRLSCAAVPLPEDTPLLDESFDAVISIALLMHVPDSDLFETVLQLKRVLKPAGVAFVSVSSGRPGVNTDSRGLGGRLFRERPPEELQLLFERLGFRLAARYQTPDALQRGMLWHSLVFQLDEPGTVRSIDQIETIIRRDRKDATYKLALLRALCDIAQTSYRRTRWYQEGWVGVPLGLVAEKWLFYYWPLVEPDVRSGAAPVSVAFPQKRGAERNKPIAFRAALLKLIRHYSRLGGLTSFAQDYRQQRLEGSAVALADEALNKIANTIVVGPVRYAGGALNAEERFFSFHGRQQAKGRCFTARGLEAALGEVLVPAPVWREMCLIGYWVSESIILRWAELTAEISEKRLEAAQVVEKLLIRPKPERDIEAAYKAYASQGDLRCVWTSIALKQFEIDHLIPFSLWYNNDLWNLLPAARRVNQAKRDKLVSRPTLLASRDLIIHYWRLLRSLHEKRIELEIGRALLGREVPRSSWEREAFTGLLEAVETVALQRGVQRWSA
jgi:SAM-dependent methyltransferase